jgi:hypothetical protein
MHLDEEEATGCFDNFANADLSNNQGIASNLA